MVVSCFDRYSKNAASNCRAKSTANINNDLRKSLRTCASKSSGSFIEFMNSHLRMTSAITSTTAINIAVVTTSRAPPRRMARRH